MGGIAVHRYMVNPIAIGAKECPVEDGLRIFIDVRAFMGEGWAQVFDCGLEIVLKLRLKVFEGIKHGIEFLILCAYSIQGFSASPFALVDTIENALWLSRRRGIFRGPAAGKTQTKLPWK